ncbi:hypothetical protein PG994_012472 [Apiospora phragmitis]|uniref:DUF1772 domain-containing protein n=1 Tax=Apiospora phragmitis TaxID=2905665 RepID=A0ABR1TVZ1_9PEZI
MSLSGIAVPVLLEASRDIPQLAYAWTRMYHYGHLALPTMGVGTCLLYLVSAYRSRKGRATLFAAAVATVAMVPFTWVFMTPTNNQLFGLEAAAAAGTTGLLSLDEVRDLIVWWSRLHITRSLMPLLGAMLGATEIVSS